MPTSGDDDYDDSDAESSCYHFLNTPSPCSGCGKVIAKIEEDVESNGAEESSGITSLLLLPPAHLNPLLTVCSDDILSEVYVRESDFIYYQHGTTTISTICSLLLVYNVPLTLHKKQSMMHLPPRLRLVTMMRFMTIGRN